MNNQLVAWLTALSAMDKGVIAVWGLMLLAYGINRQHPKWFRGSGIVARDSIKLLRFYSAVL
ncbi:MAG: hypothetical protein DUD32_10525 [Lactobacillus sp.]|nr:MAG: hypothetical protein DUD32_10525 [Lactobacillus sp.]